MIQLYTRTLPPLPPITTAGPATHRKTEKEMLTEEEGKGVGVEPKSYDCKKAQSSINHSNLSASFFHELSICL
jgi:hypothetical protein